MEYSKPQDILFEDSRIDKLKKIAKDPYVVSNFFSKEEISYINEQKDKGEKVSKFGKVVNWKYNKNNEFRDWLENKFKETLEHDFTMHGGNYFQTNVPFYVHTDTSKNEEPGILPYKNIVCHKQSKNIVFTVNSNKLVWRLLCFERTVFKSQTKL